MIFIIVELAVVIHMCIDARLSMCVVFVFLTYTTSVSSFKFRLQVPRRKRSHPDEGWIEWPMLGEGWKRKEVVRRSGSSIGQKDVYYLR